jgi:hypothetical protein
VAQRAEEDEAQSGKTPLRPVEVTPELEVEQVASIAEHARQPWCTNYARACAKNLLDLGV